MLKSDLDCWIPARDESVQNIIVPWCQKVFCDIVISSDNLTGMMLSCLLICTRQNSTSFRHRKRTSG